MVVTIAGEVDVDTAPRVQETLMAVLRDGAADVVLDVSRVEFMDASGVNVLLRVGQKAEQTGRRFRLRRASPAVRRLLELLELDGAVAVEG